MLARVGPRLIHSKVLGPSLSGQRRGLLSAIASAHHAPWYCLRPKQSLSTVQESQQTPGNRYAPKGHLKHRCFVAFGGNEGSKASKIGMIERACNVLDNYEDILLVRSSSLYETRPMYYTDQPDFINGVCEIKTSLDPNGLLKRLKHVEDKLGRRRTVDKGPRCIDLDILLYDSLRLNATDLVIPHELMMEREFVLRPLCDLIPNDFHPSSRQHTFRKYLDQLPKDGDNMRVVVPLRKGGPYLDPSTKSKMTHLMGIINLSPDSFSDGGVLRSSDLSSIRKAALSHIKNGARILDVGGQSTKPHAKMISAAEEMSRIIPAIRTLDALRTLPEADHVIVSVDTYRAEVARAAVEAGADIVNDVSAGSLDPAMLSTVANLGCTVCMAHLRGSPETMNSLADYPNGVVDEVGKELVQRLYEAERAGIRRWRIILDPGIGFAKTSDHNLEILRSFSALRATAGLTSLPWLVGTSRKAFIGKITGVETPRDRSIGTAVSVAAAIQGGSDIVRVHDIANMNQAVRMAQAIWRPIRSDMTGASDLSSESDA